MGGGFYGTDGAHGSAATRPGHGLGRDGDGFDPGPTTKDLPGVEPAEVNIYEERRLDRKRRVSHELLGAEKVLARMWFEHTTSKMYTPVTLDEIVSRRTWTAAGPSTHWRCRGRHRRPTQKGVGTDFGWTPDFDLGGLSFSKPVRRPMRPKCPAPRSTGGKITSDTDAKDAMLSEAAAPHANRLHSRRGWRGDCS